MSGRREPAPDQGAVRGRVSDRGRRFAVVLEVDGRGLPLKEFVHDMLGAAVTGLVSGLRGGENARDVSVRVRRL